MKRIVALLGLAACASACGDNNVGNRTYDMQTKVDSANYPIGNTHDDTTATTNNNAYNPDSMPKNATMENIGSAANRPDSGQARMGAGASIPDNVAPQKRKP